MLPKQSELGRRSAHEVLVTHIDAWFPQTQCTNCGYPCCWKYAEAIALGKADINQCPPGGEVTIRAIAMLLEIAPKPLNPTYGEHKPRTKALIDELLCIGCRKCLDVCPVDAILGARKLMHSVLVQECTGCALCLPPCPVDCIVMVPIPPSQAFGRWPAYTREEAERWRRRTTARLHRLTQHKQKSTAPKQTRTPLRSDKEKRAAQIKAEIRAAVARVKARKEREG